MLLIPSRLSNQFVIPDLPYKVKVAGADIHLGPVIGFLNNRIFYDDPNLIKSRFIKYNEIKGLLYITTANRIHARGNSIQGKYYDPKSESFIEDQLPMPAVLYLRTSLPESQYQYLRKRLGPQNIYNYPFRSNKWTFWRFASRDRQVRACLPETRLFVSIRDTLNFLEQQGPVYLKPFNWSRGRGIYRLSQEKGVFVLRDSYGAEWSAPDPEELTKLLRPKLKRQYLVQEEIPFMCGKRKADFRIYLQKDGKRRWQRLWVDMRLAEKGSIITNLRNRNEVMPGFKGLGLAYGLSKEAANAKLDEVTSVCIKALKVLERNGLSLGDVAIDFILDSNLKLWLLEVQPDYFGDVFIRKYMTDIIHPNSFFYAKALTGL